MTKEEIQKIFLSQEEVYKQLEENNKKCMITFWILMICDSDKPVYTTRIGLDLYVRSGNFTIDKQSLYRALRRLTKQGLLEVTQESSANGPDLKSYVLSRFGKQVLQRFIIRNIGVFYKPDVKEQVSKYL